MTLMRLIAIKYFNHLTALINPSAYFIELQDSLGLSMVDFEGYCIVL